MLRFVFKNSVFYTFSSQIPMFANLILYPLISEFLTGFDYYVFGTAMGYLGMIMMLGDLGMTPLFQNTYFKKKRNYKVYWSHYLGFLFVYRFVFGLAASWLIWIALHDQVETERLWIIIALVVTPIISFDLARGIGMRLMQFKHRHHIVQRITIVVGVLTVTTTFICIYILKLGYFGFFIANFVSMISQGIAFSFILFGSEKILPVVKLNRKRIAGWLKFSMPLIPHKFSDYLLSSSDRVVLDQSIGSANVTTSTVGMYNVAYSFAGYFTHFNNQINTIITPIYFGMFRDNSETAQHLVRSFTYVWLAFCILTASLAGLWSKEVFQFFFINNTDGLEQSYKYVIFLFMAICYRPLYAASVDFLIFNERTVSMYKISTAAGVLNVVLNVLLIPFFGVEIAIFSTYICYMYMGISGHLFPNTRKYIPVSYRPLRIFAMVTLIGFAVTYAVELNWVVKLFITVAVGASTALWYVKKGKSLVKELNKYRVQSD